MNGRASRFNRDVRSETSVSDRDVSSKRHAQAVTFQAQPLSSFLTTSTTGNPHPPTGPNGHPWTRIPRRHLAALVAYAAVALVAAALTATQLHQHLGGNPA